MQTTMDRCYIPIAFWMVVAVNSQFGVAQTNSKIVAVGLFKNGLATIQRETKLNGPGRYPLSEAVDPIHGTYFVESQDSVESMIIPVTKTETTGTPLGKDLQRELAGATVQIQLRNHAGGVRGEVLPISKNNEKISDGRSMEHSLAVTPTPPAQPSRFLILKTDKGIAYVDIHEIVTLESTSRPEIIQQTVTTTRNELVLNVGPGSLGGTVHIHYLANGIAWAPNYRVNIEDESQLTLEQQAVIRNELEDLTNTEVSLISGYPNVQFGHLLSPFSTKQTWGQFFQQLNQRPGRGNVIMSNSVVSQAAAYAGANDASAEPGGPANLGDTLDLHFQPIGKHNLPKGGSMAVSAGKIKTSYSRVVEWIIPDNRDEWGASLQSRRTDPFSGDLLQDDVWDCIKFKNGLPFPMTTAPALVTSQGRFSGQSQILWTNRNEEATLKVNKAMSIRARYVEYENPTGEAGQSERDITYLSGRRLRSVTVNGELRLCNHRSAHVNMHIQRQFSGDIVSSEYSPKIELREEGIWSLNKRNQLTWKLELKPAEERTVKYQYRVLVPF